MCISAENRPNEGVVVCASVSTHILPFLYFGLKTLSTDTITKNNIISYSQFRIGSGMRLQ